MAKPGLRNSEGCRLNPRLSQRRAPFTSDPTNGTSTSPTIMAAASRIARRRAVSLGRIEATNITSSPTTSQRRCSQKK